MKDHPDFKKICEHSYYKKNSTWCGKVFFRVSNLYAIRCHISYNVFVHSVYILSTSKLPDITHILIVPQVRNQYWNQKQQERRKYKGSN